MKIYEWEIWHTYSTYLSNPKINLIDATYQLVKSGFALCSMHRDGYTVWKSKPGIQKGFTNILMNPSKNGAKIRLDVENNAELVFDDFVNEAWYQSAYMRFCELMLCGDSSQIPPPYIRVYLGLCTLINKKENCIFKCYPVIKLFESGIMLVEFRTLSPQHSISLENFISYYVNLPRFDYDEILVPPSLSKFATFSYYQYVKKWPIHLRAGLMYMNKLHSIAVDEKTTIDNQIDFSFKQAPLSRTEEEGQYEQLSSLAQTIFSSIAYIISKPRVGLTYFVLGQKKLIEAGNYWTGRPHIHLIRFEDQKYTAKKNEMAHGSKFSMILSRTIFDDEVTALKELPKDCRLFNDFNVYINIAASLWVWSKKGLIRQKKWADPNRGHLIYEHQIKSELLEYGYMLHRSLFDRISQFNNTNEVLSIREELVQLKLSMRESSVFGEIRDLLNYGWRLMGVPELQKLITEKLSIREIRTSRNESRRIEKLGIILTIIFGFFALPQFANEFVKPLWNLLKFWYPQDKLLANLYYELISAIILASIVFILYKKLFPKKEVSF